MRRMRPPCGGCSRGDFECPGSGGVRPESRSSFTREAFQVRPVRAGFLAPGSWPRSRPSPGVFAPSGGAFQAPERAGSPATVAGPRRLVDLLPFYPPKTGGTLTTARESDSPRSPLSTTEAASRVSWFVVTNSTIAIIGGGISGLAAAWTLQKNGVPYQLLEASPRLGGVIRTESKDGFVLEGGPDSILAQKPEGVALCRELGLGDRLIPTNPELKAVYILRGGRLHPLPEGMMLAVPTKILPFLKSGLFSWPGKVRMGLDFVRPARPGNGDESIASFLRRRFGQEAVERLGEPLLAGIHAGDPERLSILATFPRFRDLEVKHGSLVRGMLSAPRPKPRPGARPPAAFYSLRGGLRELVEALVEPAVAGVRADRGGGALGGPRRRRLRGGPRGRRDRARPGGHRRGAGSEDRSRPRRSPARRLPDLVRDPLRLLGHRAPRLPPGGRRPPPRRVRHGRSPDRGPPHQRPQLRLDQVRPPRPRRATCSCAAFLEACGTAMSWISATRRW